MTLLGYKTTITVDNTVAGTLQTFLAANLTTWTVGSLATIGSSTTERNYILLTHATSGEKILIYCPNGSASTVANGIHSSRASNYINSGAARPLAFAYDPLGEIVDAGTTDPYTSGYWSSCLGASYVNNIDIWASTATEYLYVMEDTTLPLLVVYCSPTNGLSPHGFAMLGEIYDNTYFPTLANSGFMLADVTTGTPPALSTMLRRIWLANKTWYGGTANNWTAATTLPYNYPLTHIVNAIAPPSSTVYLSCPLLIKNDAYFYNILANENLLRGFSATTETYGQKSSTRELIHLYTYILTPWPTALAIPGA